MERPISGLELSLVGMAIVFGVLALIAAIVTLVRWFDRHWEEREARQEETALARDPGIDALTLVLISAAAATVIGGRHRIRRVRRVSPGSSSVWSMQGRSVLLGSHVVAKAGGRGRGGIEERWR